MPHASGVPIVSPVIETSAGFMDQVVDLRCPCCGQGYLHHKSVTAYDRQEDEEMLTRTKVENGMVASHLVPHNADNPSQRRHGLVIEFDCENCRADPIQLRFAQHKGVTHVSWRYVDHEEPPEPDDGPWPPS
jgi:hypothetical protein